MRFGLKTLNRFAFTPVVMHLLDMTLSAKAGYQFFPARVRCRLRLGTNVLPFPAIPRGLYATRRFPLLRPMVWARPPRRRQISFAESEASGKWSSTMRRLCRLQVRTIGL